MPAQKAGISVRKRESDDQKWADRAYHHKTLEYVLEKTFSIQEPLGERPPRMRQSPPLPFEPFPAVRFFARCQTCFSEREFSEALSDHRPILDYAPPEKPKRVVLEFVGDAFFTLATIVVYLMVAILLLFLGLLLLSEWLRAPASASFR